MIAMEALENATDALVLAERESAEANAANLSPKAKADVKSGLQAATAKYNDAKNAMAVAVSKVNEAAQGGRRNRKSRSTRRRRTQQRVGGVKNDVFVVYKSGGPESPDFVGVFDTLENAKKHVLALIGELNKHLEEDEHFKMDVRKDGMMAWSESEDITFYCKSVKSY